MIFTIANTQKQLKKLLGIQFLQVRGLMFFQLIKIKLTCIIKEYRHKISKENTVVVLVDKTQNRVHTLKK